MKKGMQTHLLENSKESQQHLEANEGYFSDQCLMVLKLLNQGIRISVKSAINDYGIASIARRILDLKERNGIKNIQDEWIKDGNGKRLYKEWYVTQPSRPTKGEVVEKWNKELYNTESVHQVTLRDGVTVLKLGDEVLTNYHEKCVGLTFVICEINSAPGLCESGYRIVAYLKEDPSRKIIGLRKEGVAWIGPDGIDCNNFYLPKHKKEIK